MKPVVNRLAHTQFGMAYEPAALEIALAAAVGDDPALIAELREAFLSSASVHIAAMNHAKTPADWQSAAYRLRGLAASFGANGLMAVADLASERPIGDPGALRLVGRAYAREQA